MNDNSKRTQKDIQKRRENDNCNIAIGFFFTQTQLTL